MIKKSSNDNNMSGRYQCSPYHTPGDNHSQQCTQDPPISSVKVHTPISPFLDDTKTSLPRRWLEASTYTPIGRGLGNIRPVSECNINSPEHLPSSATTCGPLHSSRTHRVQARLTSHVLHPCMLDDLDAETLVVGVGACEVAVGEQSTRVVTADELEFFPITHNERRNVPCTVSLTVDIGRRKGTLPRAASYSFGCCGVWVPRCMRMSLQSFGCRVPG